MMCLSFPVKDGQKHTVFPDFIRRCVLFADSPGTNCTSDYRVVQEPEGNILVYGDFEEDEKKRIRLEFVRLAKDRDLLLPELAFLPYTCEPGRK